MPSDRNVNHLYAPFREKIDLVLADLQAYAERHMPGMEWRLIEGFRTAPYQNELYQKGRKTPPIGVKHRVTDCDGFKFRSNHQSSLAVDIIPFKGNSPVWNPDLQHWGYLGHVARNHGLEWGGDWRKADLPHIQWPDEDKTTYQAARGWQKTNGLR
jgi:hypothetical protein